MLSTSTALRGATFLVAATATLVVAGCGGNEAKPKGGPGGRGGPPQVGFVVVQPTSVALTTELAGRTVAFQSSEVRPQVSGIIQRRFFTEGSIVRRGQALYQIDPSLYRAAVNEAQANLQSARANADATRILAERYKPLAAAEAISKQDYTNAIASARQATASVAQTNAALDTARTNLRFTTVPAPITGRIGRSLLTVGALATTSQTEPLATIQQLDPIYVDIQQSSADLLRLRRALATDGIVPSRANVTLRLEDGTDYGLSGSVEFAEVVVDPSTGTVALRARFPNPQGLLLPGMFVRASFAQAIDSRAFLVPQQAVSRDPKGNATVYVVGPGNKAVQKSVLADRAQGAFWVVTRGLNPGDRVITQGTANLTPNIAVRPVAADTPERIAPPPQGREGAAAPAQTKGG